MGIYVQIFEKNPNEESSSDDGICLWSWFYQSSMCQVHEHEDLAEWPFE